MVRPWKTFVGGDEARAPVTGRAYLSRTCHHLGAAIAQENVQGPTGSTSTELVAKRARVSLWGGPGRGIELLRLPGYGPR